MINTHITPIPGILPGPDYYSDFQIVVFAPAYSGINYIEIPASCATECTKGADINIPGGGGGGGGGGSGGGFGGDEDKKKDEDKNKGEQKNPEADGYEFVADAVWDSSDTLRVYACVSPRVIIDGSSDRFDVLYTLYGPATQTGSDVCSYSVVQTGLHKGNAHWYPDTSSLVAKTVYPLVVSFTKPSTGTLMKTITLQVVKEAA
jgi:hypothetical protein